MKIAGIVTIEIRDPKRQAVALVLNVDQLFTIGGAGGHAAAVLGICELTTV